VPANARSATLTSCRTVIVPGTGVVMLRLQLSAPPASGPGGPEFGNITTPVPGTFNSISTIMVPGTHL
jgi:hypothetical protein